MNYEGSHFASFLPLTIVVRGRSTIFKENNGYTTYKVFLSVSFGLNVPSATITIETSSLVLQIESRKTSFYVVFNTVNRRNPHQKRCILQSALVKTSLL